MRLIRSYAILLFLAPLLALFSFIGDGNLQFLSSAMAQDVTEDAQEPLQSNETQDGTEDAQGPSQSADTQKLAQAKTTNISIVKNAVPNTAQEAATELVKAYDARDWTLVFASGVMLFVYVLRITTNLLGKIGLNTKALVWISLGTGLLAGLTNALIAGLPWPAAIMEGVLIGLAGSGLWSSIGKISLPITTSDT